jgi:magnesium transporter
MANRTATSPATPETVITVRHPDGSNETLPPDRLGRISDLIGDPDTLIWVSATAPNDRTLAELGTEFGLHDLAVEDLRKRRQRPKLDSYEKQKMVVVYEASERERSGVSEIHLFIGRNWVVSVTWSPTPMLEAVHQRLAQEHGGIHTIGHLLYALLDSAVDSYFPVLDRVSDQIEKLEQRVLEGDADRRSLAEILRLKRRLLELRRVLAPMRDLANALLRSDVEAIGPDEAPYYQDLYDHLVRVIDQVDLYRDLLASVLDARLTVASNSLNAVMKRLTAFTVVLMVPTLIAGVYGMNFHVMPELTWPLGYPLALGLMVAASAAVFVWFRRRDWF